MYYQWYNVSVMAKRGEKRGAKGEVYEVLHSQSRVGRRDQWSVVTHLVLRAGCHVDTAL